MIMRPSLQRQLLGWVLGMLLAVWVAFVAAGYRTGLHEADELTDGHLAGVAALLLAYPSNSFAPKPHSSDVADRPELSTHDYQQSLSVVIWEASGKLLARTGQAPLPTFDYTEGFSTLLLGDPAREWRVFSRWDNANHGRKIMVLLSLAERDSLAQDIAEHVATPGLWLLPVIALVLVVAIRRGLRPLYELSGRVHALDIHNNVPLVAPPHLEFQVMVNAINTLTERYNLALLRERELANEFAHELRTPLASLRLHANLLRGRLSEEEREAALVQVDTDAARSASVISDLLSLARASRAQLAEAAQDFDLASLARRVTSEYGQTAYSTGHELSLGGVVSVPMRGHPILVELALRNLLENALAHTPKGTWVEIVAAAQPVRLEVRDNGPQTGANQAQPATILGLGLGHQVVKRVAAVHGGSFDIVDEPAASRVYRVTLEKSVSPLVTPRF
ncbi:MULTISPECIES: histidine kinase dimerization/phospho-acceptor domain-containing protein [unclassified Acidovorax]|uniref:histidine kinase dimerization/phospho-acceptor domain-containing protein n=1 Tax=unclassified Acidovorax TaxID=2684926 RepID=UPI0023DE3F54|nr:MULTISPECIES: histidine kinase dimerization/phospho-acceptor domain-containing protein [unclassified Acidovorax]GKS92827.1 sensor histidine kinase [Acidovorax sp. SUPP2539]GKS97569.1 sensor histidine kinase [Acidovorax sp. SUPP2825]